MNKLKVLLADDNKELITVLSEYISLQDDMEVVEVAGNGNEVLSVIYLLNYTSLHFSIITS